MSGQHGRHSEEKFLGNVECFFSGGYFKLKSLICLFRLKIYKKKTTNKQTNPACLFFFFFFCRYKETTDVLNEITSAEKYSKFLRPFHKGNIQKKCTVTFKCTQSKAKGPAKTGSKYGALTNKKGVFGVEETYLHSHTGYMLR